MSTRNLSRDRPPQALRAGTNVFFKCLDVHCKLPDSCELRHKSRTQKQPFDPALRAGGNNTTLFNFQNDQPAAPSRSRLISQKVFIKSFCKSQLPQKSVNLSFITTNIKNKLTDSCGNRLFQNYFLNTFWEIKYASIPAVN